MALATLHCSELLGLSFAVLGTHRPCLTLEAKNCRPKGKPFPEVPTICLLRTNLLAVPIHLVPPNQCPLFCATTELESTRTTSMPFIADSLQNTAATYPSRMEGTTSTLDIFSRRSPGDVSQFRWEQCISGSFWLLRLVG